MINYPVGKVIALTVAGERVHAQIKEHDCTNSTNSKCADCILYSFKNKEGKVLREYTIERNGEQWTNVHACALFACYSELRGDELIATHLVRL